MPRLEIVVHGHLLVAGNQDLALGVDLTTARRFQEGLLVPYIPATALRGAIRMQLEALLAGAGEPDVDPYPLDREVPPATLDSPVARLFGYSGQRGSRTHAREGCLRFGDALPTDPARALQALGVDITKNARPSSALVNDVKWAVRLSDGRDIYGPGYTDCVLACRANLIRENPAGLKAVIKGMMRAQFMAETKQAEALQRVVGAYYKTSKENARLAMEKQPAVVDARATNRGGDRGVSRRAATGRGPAPGS